LIVNVQIRQGLGYLSKAHTNVHLFANVHQYEKNGAFNQNQVNS